MIILDITEATGPLREYAQKIADGPVIITDDGKPVAALLPVGNADLETVELSSNPEFLRIIESSRALRESTEGISSEEVRKRLESEK